MWRWALGGSLVVHLLVLVFSPILIRVGLPPGTPDPEAVGFRGIEMVDLQAPAARQPAETQEVPLPTTTPAEAAPATQRPEPVQPSPAQPGDAPRTGEAATEPRGAPLEPGLRDRRLWITPRELPEREPTQEELHAEYMAGLEARLRMLNDSVAGEADRARRATDWTVRDGQGRRWGVSPDGIHLGDLTLPPMTFPPGGGDSDRRRRAEEQERTREEIDRQEADAERRRVRDERTRATRERMDREREERRQNPPE